MFFLFVSLLSYTYLPIQRDAFPHIMASEPSALKIRMLKSAIFDEPIRTSPSEPIPVWGALNLMASSSGFRTGKAIVFTYM